MDSQKDRSSVIAPSLIAELLDIAIDSGPPLPTI